eukprot:m.120730 g.120730  ORF g.120730 m.120730 type:complete len:303 (-) comp15620_c1_seq2:5477-6385(-)
MDYGWEESEDDYEEVVELDDEELQRRFMAGHLKGKVSMEKLVKKAAARRIVPVNRDDAMNSKRKEMELLPSLSWPETFVMVQPALDEDLDANDDFAREDAFYQRALEAVLVGEKKLAKYNLPKARPNDYFAEMVKTDDHMERVRQKMLNEKAAMEASERARKQREIKKFGKQVQQDVLAKRQAEKKATLEAVKRRRKGMANKLGTNDALDFDVDTIDYGDRTTNKTKTGKNPKRAKKDAKYGNGGGKRNSRRNTGESVGDTTGYSGRQNKKPFPGTQGSKGRSKQAGNKRPGKATRQKQKKK